MHKLTKKPVLAALLATLLSGCKIAQLGIVTVAAAVGLAGYAIYKRGVLILDFVERSTKHLLWRGAIMAEIDMSWPEERKQERCNAVINELLHYYPHP